MYLAIVSKGTANLAYICSTTTTEAAENQAKLLQEHSSEIMQSHHAHSVLLRELISRQEEQARALEIILAGSAGSTRPPSAGSRPSDHRSNSDNSSIMSRRSTLSLRFRRPDYLEDLKESRAYKRLRHFGRGIDIDSGAESVFSCDSGGSTGNWSMLSDMTLGDLSVSQIAVLNLPIDLTDVSNPQPFLESSSAETRRSSGPRPRRIWSSRGIIHNAIENGNEFVVRTVLAMGMDIEEADSNGRTPLLHAIEKHHVAICNLLVERGATITRDASGDEALLAHTAQMLYNLGIHDCGSFEGICEALLGSKSNVDITTVGKMSMARIAVSMQDLVNGGYKSILQLLSLIESRDANGWTPLASAAFNNNEALCEFLVEKGCSLCLDTEQKKLKPTLSRRIHAAAEGGHETALQLLLDMGADIDERNSGGETALLGAVYYNHLSCVKVLIERGADATILPNNGSSVLHRAAWRSTDSEMMKLLLDDKSETRKFVDMKDFYGDTALYDCSIEDSQSPIVRIENAKMLLQAGASLTIKNNKGETPYECARDRRRKEFAKYLWSQLSPEQQAQEKPPPSDW